MPLSTGSAGGQAEPSARANTLIVAQPQSVVNAPFAHVTTTLQTNLDRPPFGVSKVGVTTVGGGGAAAGTPGGTPTPASGQIFPTGQV